MGEILPPHLSPFIDPEKDQQYIPPEARPLYDENELEVQHKLDEKMIDQEEENLDASKTTETKNEDNDNNKIDEEGGGGKEAVEEETDIVEKVSNEYD